MKARYVEIFFFFKSNQTFCLLRLKISPFRVSVGEKPLWLSKVWFSLLSYFLLFFFPVGQYYQNEVKLQAAPGKKSSKETKPNVHLRCKNLLCSSRGGEREKTPLSEPWILHFMPATIMLKGQVLQHLMLRFACKVFQFANDPRLRSLHNGLKKQINAGQLKIFFLHLAHNNIYQRGVIAVCRVIVPFEMHVNARACSNKMPRNFERRQKVRFFFKDGTSFLITSNDCLNVLKKRSWREREHPLLCPPFFSSFLFFRTTDSS